MSTRPMVYGYPIPFEGLRIYAAKHQLRGIDDAFEHITESVGLYLVVRAFVARCGSKGNLLCFTFATNDAEDFMPFENVNPDHIRLIKEYLGIKREPSWWPKEC
ncbi:hypothetical protein BV25DRAFT_1833666 [Artomyces pyxidatus]|uniref:Uncharacterized protein n=1 Tax=Artomyces pyxidatus TaxID=48021 RepID=A0ACB8SET7_9AGAM|nr:hypothetical protein BV25DRAFT_1833666 [Artomyces pyxidatus]